MTTLLQSDPTSRSTAREPAFEPVADTASCYWRDLDRSEDSLLDFDQDLPNGLAGAQTLLQLHPEIYRNHLAIAKFLDGWVDRILSDVEMGESEFAYAQALVDIAADLRAGDFTDAPTASERRLV